MSGFSGRTTLFKPHNPTGAPAVSSVSSVSIPSDFASRAVTMGARANRVTVGNQTLSGTYDFAALGSTRDNPYVWYVTGNLSASGAVALKGYVVLVTLGNIELTGNASADFGDANPESHSAWHAGGNMSLGGNSSLWGQFYVDGNLKLSGTPGIYGNVTVRGSATISGTPDLYYIGASSGLTSLWQSVTSATTYERMSYSEGWD